ncbi:MAG: phosphomannomutase/phosphoglucomutase [Clostridia bacterium]|nr:phosphomannomutase/phosphoglucomutase [Clostridia bacterium]
MKQLKSGTDIRGTALGDNPTLTAERAELFGKAFALWLTEQGAAAPLTVAVGRDPRLSGESLKEGLVRGLLAMGVRVLDCGLATTPSMFFSTYYEKSGCDGAVEITASHLPYDKNGLKFFTKNGGIDGGVVSRLIELAEQNEFPACAGGAVEQFDLMTPYSESLIALVRNKTGEDLPLAGVKVVVDAGNGAGGFFVEKVLKPLGAETAGSVFLEPDGRFPNHIPNPENKAAMKACADATMAAGADMGICFDTDCDRAALVDASGMEINRNRMIAMIAALMLREHPGCTIVTDSVTSQGLKKFIEGRGGVHHRFMRGYKKVIDEAVRLESTGVCAPLAMETSGHGALKENRYLDDGSYLAARMLAELALLKKQGKALLSLIEGLEEPVEALELRADITVEHFKVYGARVLDELEAYCKAQGWALETPNFEGVRVNFGKAEGEGWFLVRMSLHDPVVPINIESNSAGGAVMIADRLYEFLAQYENLALPKYKGE